MNPHYPQTAQRAGHRCEYCHAPEVVFNFPFEVEHIVPLSREGQDEDSNRALACRSCNLYKSNHSDGLDPITQARVRLFHPRHDTWVDHLHADLETGEIIGLTEIGRAVIHRLEMNSSAQIGARLRWMRLDLFP